jgi:hypothetical protein
MSSEQLLVDGDGREQLEPRESHARFSALEREPFPTRIAGLSPRVIFLAEIGHPVIVHVAPVPRRVA